jgi:hypothetical protein
MKRADWLGVAVVVAGLTALNLFRHVYVEPREWVGLCAASAPPVACLPRAGLEWLQQWQLWGTGALLLGVWAFLGGPFAVAVSAVTVGAAAVAYYNATWGMIGVALGAWAWVRRERGSAPGAAG